MKYSKSTFLRVLGVIVLGTFIFLSYVNNHIFLDKIILCSAILGMVLFAKTRGESNDAYRNIDSSKYSNLR